MANTSYTTNISQIGAYAGRLAQTPHTAQNVLATNPIFGRPRWTYTRVQAGPVRGPQPKLARGSGRTGDTALPGNASGLPGYLSDNEYFPTTYTYDPTNNPSFYGKYPRSINVGDDGLHALNPTYRAHDFTPADRFTNHMRRAANWQVMEYPPTYRNLLAWQQVQRYRVGSFTLSARPLEQNDYFLGYQVDPRIQQALGQSTLGYMGSM